MGPHHNLTKGGNTYEILEKTRKLVSVGVFNYYKNKKHIKFSSIKTSDISSNIEDHIRPLNRYGKQYGWYVYINKCKTDFGGVHINLDESHKNAKLFIIELKNKLAKHLDAGNSLEPLTTTYSRKLE